MNSYKIRKDHDTGNYIVSAHEHCIRSRPEPKEALCKFAEDNDYSKRVVYLAANQTAKGFVVKGVFKRYHKDIFEKYMKSENYGPIFMSDGYKLLGTSEEIFNDVTQYIWYRGDLTVSFIKDLGKAWRDGTFQDLYLQSGVTLKPKPQDRTYIFESIEVAKAVIDNNTSVVQKQAVNYLIQQAMYGRVIE